MHEVGEAGPQVVSLSVLLAALPGLSFPFVQLEGTMSPGHRADNRLLGQQREPRILPCG